MTTTIIVKLPEVPFAPETWHVLDGISLIGAIVSNDPRDMAYDAIPNFRGPAKRFETRIECAEYLNRLLSI